MIWNFLTIRANISYGISTRNQVIMKKKISLTTRPDRWVIETCVKHVIMTPTFRFFLTGNSE